MKTAAESLPHIDRSRGLEHDYLRGTMLSLMELAKSALVGRRPIFEARGKQKIGHAVLTQLVTCIAADKHS